MDDLHIAFASNPSWHRCQIQRGDFLSDSGECRVFIATTLQFNPAAKGLLPTCHLRVTHYLSRNKLWCPPCTVLRCRTLDISGPRAGCTPVMCINTNNDLGTPQPGASSRLFVHGRCRAWNPIGQTVVSNGSGSRCAYATSPSFDGNP